MATNRIRYQLVAAVSCCVPAALSLAGTISENFAVNPSEKGWAAVGDSSLFQWDAPSETLKVTWDSSRPNSYYAVSVGMLGKTDNFSVSFDLRLEDVAAGISPGKPNPFQLAVGFVNLSRASQTNFFRGSGMDSPDLVEFSFFPDPGGAWQLGPSLTATMIDATGTNWSSGGYAPLALATNTNYRIVMSYTAADHTLRTSITQESQPFATLPDSKPTAGFTDFTLDHFAICSYSEAGQPAEYIGSILAHGSIDNVVLTTPPALSVEGERTANGRWQVRFPSRTGVSYTLERSVDLSSWSTVAEAIEGDGTQLVIEDTTAPADRAFYRVRAER